MPPPDELPGRAGGSPAQPRPPDPGRGRETSTAAGKSSAGAEESAGGGSPPEGLGGAPRGRYLALLSVGALGIVYGDIGTSPLYALRECFSGTHPLSPTPDNVLGVLSLIFWALTLIICVEYLVFVLRADNRGEGGILALMSLIPTSGGRKAGGAGPRGRAPWLLLMMGLFGAALLYGDGMITPAISVLSAVEGLRVATPDLGPWVDPVTIVILVLLFLLQRRGTGGIGSMFGPVMFVWFSVLALLGAWQVAAEPGVLGAINPLLALRFFANNGWLGFLTLGAVFLVVTGGEALYADMGHFGRRPIRVAWFTLVLPALLLNYFGQGALLIRDPTAAENPFYRMGPSWAMYPLVGLATVAAIIASQAVISGAFSLTRQATQLGYCPRVEIRHTSAREIGQIYVPWVNWGLMAATIGLVIGFRSSSNLAAAYGVAVTLTMATTTLLLSVVAAKRWGWPPWAAALLIVPFFALDLAFFGANMVKVAHGGWFPLVVAAAIFTCMVTWRTGRRILAERLAETSLAVETFLASLPKESFVRVPGVAVFMAKTTSGTPSALLHNYKHNKVIHEQVVFLTVKTLDQPYVPQDERFTIESLGQGFYRLVVRYGFVEDPDIPKVLEAIDEPGLEFVQSNTTYFLGKETLIASERPGMAMWREHLFSIMSRNARAATHFFRLPANRVVELGAQIEL